MSWGSHRLGDVARRIVDPAVRESATTKRARIASPAGGAVGGRIVTDRRRGVVDAEACSELDDLPFGEMQQRSANADRPPAFDSAARGERREALERGEVFGTAVGV